MRYLSWLALPVLAAAQTRWIDIRTLGVEGQGWTELKAPFDRLPAKAEGVVLAPVWSLSQDSAGLSVRFTTAASSIRARWTVRRERLALAPHAGYGRERHGSLHAPQRTMALGGGRTAGEDHQ